ncbi:hypothetical protein LXL04_009423 [Taraxacum kok-saghyz]
MNCRGGYGIARHAGGGGGGKMYGMSKVEMIMLKYRPIAPKPVSAGLGSGSSTTESNGGYVKCRRGKRKYVRVNANKTKKNKKVTTSSSPPPPLVEETVVTLSLLPETPDRKVNSPGKSFADLLSSTEIKNKCNFSNRKSAPAPRWLSFGGFDPTVVVKPPPPPPRRLQVMSTSYVTVECVRVTDGLGIVCTDMERVMNMEMDTCPGFISDSRDRVVWTNMAFRQMVGGGEEMSVVLVRKDNWTPSPVIYSTFTCKVKISSATHYHSPTASPPASVTRTLPCDVWRMERGACAWQLDVKAALSLGR